MAMTLTLLERKPRWLLATCVLLCILVGLADYWVGRTSLSIFYVFPVFLATWLPGTQPGLITAIVYSSLSTISPDMNRCCW